MLCLCVLVLTLGIAAYTSLPTPGMWPHLDVSHLGACMCPCIVQQYQSCRGATGEETWADHAPPLNLMVGNTDSNGTGAPVVQERWCPAVVPVHLSGGFVLHLLRPHHMPTILHRPTHVRLGHEVRHRRVQRVWRFAVWRLRMHPLPQGHPWRLCVLRRPPPDHRASFGSPLPRMWRAALPELCCCSEHTLASRVLLLHQLRLRSHGPLLFLRWGRPRVPPLVPVRRPWRLLQVSGAPRGLGSVRRGCLLPPAMLPL